MPEDNTTTTPTMSNNSSVPTENPVALSDSSAPSASPTPPASDPSPAPAEDSSDSLLPDQPTSGPLPEVPNIYREVASKITESHNVLIALSSDPSVDEMCAAIGLSLYLDKLGKRATAIYSGSTPNALEFLKPEETFESTADTLQDFVIALSKEKADHLRYKLDGDFVKIYITPYRNRITADDLDFSYGDFNVDLVLALDVTNGIDLDSALREHGRIMHDAVIINITTGNPGKFGEIEWSDKKASSVSEMIAKLLYTVKSEVVIGKEEATAFLTGIVAATNRFSNAHTTPETMQLSARLMRSGANQQLIAKNITPDVDNEMYSILNQSDATPPASSPQPKTSDPTKLNIQHGNEKDADDTKEVEGTVTEKESTLLNDLKAAEASLSQTGAETTPDYSNQPVRLGDLSDSASEPTPEPTPEPVPESISEPTSEPIPELASEPVPEEPILAAEPTPVSAPESAAEPTSASEPTPEPVPEPTSATIEPAAPTPVEEPTLPEVSPSSSIDDKQPTEKVIAPPADSEFAQSPDDGNKYGHMLEEALAELTNPGSATAFSGNPAAFSSNPATVSAPSVAYAPEINGVPEMNFMPPANEAILPPPPTPPIDMSATSPDDSLPTTPIEPATPVEEPTPEPLGPQPSMQDQVYRPQASDPGAFQIPGM